MLSLVIAGSTSAADLGKSGFVDSAGVKLHYVTAGEGPLLVLLHGFPDYHYTWRDQMPALSKHFQVVALDLRGYNKSDKPEGVDNYKMEKLVADVRGAVLKHFKQKKMVRSATIGAGSSPGTLPPAHPDKVDRLDHPQLTSPQRPDANWPTNPEQQKNSEYARTFQKPEAAKLIKPEMLVTWVKEPEAQGVPRGDEAVVDGRDAQLLQGELSASRTRPAPNCRR